MTPRGRLRRLEEAAAEEPVVVKLEVGTTARRRRLMVMGISRSPRQIRWGPNPG